jgi:hypothetical protein
MSDIVLDIETLSTRPDAVVLTIGAIKFSPFADDIDATNGFYTRIDVDEQIGMGRHISEDTIQWWGKLPAEVREDAMGEHNRDSVEKALAGLNKFLVGSENIWVQGPVFDIATLENLYRQMLMPPPWHFWNIRDSRTLFGVHGDPRQKNHQHAHNAMIDCVIQGKAIQQVYRDNNITPFKYNSSNLKYANNL